MKKIIIAIVVICVAVAVGRYTAPEKVKIETKVVEVEKRVEVKVEVEKKEKHKKTMVTEVTKPDGTKERTIVSTTDTSEDKKSKDTTKEDVNKKTEVAEEKTYGGSKVSIDLMASLNPLLVYGAHVSKEVLGPITVGAFGFTDGRIGVTLGLIF